MSFIHQQPISATSAMCNYLTARLEYNCADEPANPNATRACRSEMRRSRRLVDRAASRGRGPREAQHEANVGGFFPFFRPAATQPRSLAAHVGMRLFRRGFLPRPTPFAAPFCL